MQMDSMPFNLGFRIKHIIKPLSIEWFWNFVYNPLGALSNLMESKKISTQDFICKNIWNSVLHFLFGQKTLFQYELDTIQACFSWENLITCHQDHDILKTIWYWPLYHTSKDIGKKVHNFLKYGKKQSSFRKILHNIKRNILY